MNRNPDAKLPLFEPAGQFCPACTCNNLLSAMECEVCGVPLRGQPAAEVLEADEETLVEETSGDGLDVVPSDQRESLGQYPTEFDAEFAAGLLRSQGIAVELAPSLPYPARAPMLWVNRGDAAQARSILAEVKSRAGAPQNEDQ